MSQKSPQSTPSDDLGFNYGGQAVIEGVMMRGSKTLAVAVRDPEGAIITEVANVHTNSAVRHSDPEMNRYFLES